jgi:hypothetical protein
VAPSSRFPHAAAAIEASPSVAAMRGVDPLLASGALAQILPGWAKERDPLYAYPPSRHLPPAEVRAFLDFSMESVAE